jgi:hypothetical protein
VGQPLDIACRVNECLLVYIDDPVHHGGRYTETEKVEDFVVDWNASRYVREAEKGEEEHYEAAQEEEELSIIYQHTSEW